jgi:hypothetical protein
MAETSSPFPFLDFTTVRQQVSLLLCFLGCGYAIWRGGRPERIFGWVLLAGWAFSPFLMNTRDWFSPQWAEAVVDLTVLAVLLWLAFTSDRYWPMWCAAFHAVGVLMHVTMLVDRRVPPWSYRTASAIWSYVVLFTLVIGTMVEVHRPFRRPGPAG